ncbi:MAG: response regulator transcription factor [Crocinitomicaceae bacterium]
MNKPIRIALAEDHALFREGLASLLKEEDELLLVFEASNGEELLEGLRKHKVDVVLLDLNMPVLDGKQTLNLMQAKYPQVRPIVLTMFNTENYIIDTIRLGARGFLAKHCSIEKVVDAIYAVYEQGYYFDDEVSKTQLFKLVHDVGIQPSYQSESLSSRESTILELICNEKKNNEIADLLSISVRTVEVHRQNLLKKTNAKNVAGLVIYAIKEGYYTIYPDSDV